MDVQAVVLEPDVPFGLITAARLLDLYLSHVLMLM